MDRMLIVNEPPILDSKNVEERLISFKNDLIKLPSILHVTTSGTTPGGGHSWETHVFRKGASQEEIIPGENMNVLFVDPDFIETYGIPLQSGRVWNPESTSDLSMVLINEAALGPFGLGDAQKALQEKLVFLGDSTMRIGGVVKNFHWKSLKTEYQPIVLWPQKISYSRYSILINGDIHETLRRVEELYKAAFPGHLFEYYFLDDYFNKQYKTDLQFGMIFSLFAVLAILIACLGLWGLAAFTTLQRLREISIRKVLGASVNSIVSLLSTQFLKLLLVASAIGLPLSWYAANSWLANFAFRIHLTWDLLTVPVITLFVVALGTVSLQIMRGAKSNPAEVLRSQ
jgi:putative ABC transport system permease protein